MATMVKEENMNLIGKYQNGNYTVSLYDDGTKVRENDLDFLMQPFLSLWISKSQIVAI